MIQMERPTVIKQIGLQAARAIFTEVGDELIHDVEGTGFFRGIYPRRHIISSGTFYIDTLFGGTSLGRYFSESAEDVRKNLTVFPHINQPCGAVRLRAVEKNSSYYCILPTDSKKNIDDETNDLFTGEIFTTKLGRFYCSNIDLIVNDSKVKAFDIFACVYNTINIAPETDGKIVSFYAI